MLRKIRIVHAATVAALTAASATGSASAHKCISAAFETNDVLINRPAIECADVCVLAQTALPRAALGWTPEKDRRK